MSRVEIDMPGRFIYSTSLEIPIGDLAGGLHLGNHVLVSYLNEVLFRFLRDSGLHGEINRKSLFINADLAMIYKSESNHWDTLRFDLGIRPAGQSGLDLYYRVTNESTGREAALAKMTMLFFDYDERKVARIPEPFKVIFRDDYSVAGADAPLTTAANAGASQR